MKLLFDLHTHTIASGHAYSTLKENILEAKAKNLQAYGFADHSYKEPGGPEEIYFQNFKVIPEKIEDVIILCGVELNILDYEGNVDASQFMYDHMDYMIASMHANVMTPGTVKENMKALEKIFEDEKIKIIGHPDDERFPLDYDLLAKRAKETNTILEINNTSLSPVAIRKGARENQIKILKACEKYQTKIIINSDAHFYTDVGNLDRGISLVKEMNFPEELIINTNIKGLKHVLNDSPRLSRFEEKPWE